MKNMKIYMCWNISEIYKILNEKFENSDSDYHK